MAFSPPELPECFNPPELPDRFMAKKLVDMVSVVLFSGRTNNRWLLQSSLCAFLHPRPVLSLTRHGSCSSLASTKKNNSPNRHSDLVESSRYLANNIHGGIQYFFDGLRRLF
jgi:hypothetical protein